MGNRQGSNQYQKKGVPQNFGEARTPKERESSAIAAKAVDWNRETYRQAKTVIESGNEEVIQQMDSGELFLFGGLFFS